MGSVCSLCVFCILFSGEYLSEHDKCKLCDSTCYKCTGPESEDCISCLSTRWGVNWSLVSHSTYTAVVRPNVQCVWGEDFTFVFFGRLFDNGRCVLGCDSGKHERDGQCHLCHHTCLECSDEGPDKCTRCGKGKLVSHDRLAFSRETYRLLTLFLFSHR